MTPWTPLPRLALFVTIAWAAIPTALADTSPAVPPARFTDPARKEKLYQAMPRIESMLAERMREQHIPGLAYAVVVDGEIAAASGLGVRDVAAHAPAEADTVFRIASMTKSFTALAILKLRDAGKLGLDDPASRYVPELREWRVPTADSGPITIRHLLAHVAGLPEDDPQANYTLATPTAELSAWLTKGAAFSTATGTAYEYSNLGFMILGQIVSNVSGKPFQEYITQEILQPLGMRSTSWDPKKVPAERHASGYRYTGDAWVEEPQDPDGAGAAMGGLLSSAPDVARFVAMMLAADPPRDDPEQPPAARRTLREMQAGLGFPSVELLPGVNGAAPVPRAGSYGFGLWSLSDCTWGREVSHSGGLPGFGTNMRWLPDHGVGVIVLTNLTYASASVLTREALRLMHETGALQPRQPAPSAELLAMAETASQLVLDENDRPVRAAAAANLFIDQSLAERKRAIAALQKGLRDCKRGELHAANALRGTLRIECAGGDLDVTLSLTPEQPPRIQTLEVNAATAPKPGTPAHCAP